MLVARRGPDHTCVRPCGPRLEKLTRGHRWGYLHRGHRLRGGVVFRHRRGRHCLRGSRYRSHARNGTFSCVQIPAISTNRMQAWIS